MKTLKIGWAFIMIIAPLSLLSSCSKEESNDELDGVYSEKLMDAESLGSMCLQLDSLPAESLSEEEILALNYMREEEFLAMDVYLKMYELYKLPVFSNIQRSESQHTEAVKALLVKYGLADPAAEHITGVFENPELQNLYNILTETGSKSLNDALKVGATIEDLDIKDLLDLSEVVDNQDILLVFANLTKGSRNHLRAFNAQLVKAGIVYVPQYISQELFAEIISSPHERGCIKP